MIVAAPQIVAPKVGLRRTCSASPAAVGSQWCRLALRPMHSPSAANILAAGGVLATGLLLVGRMRPRRSSCRGDRASGAGSAHLTASAAVPPQALRSARVSLAAAAQAIPPRSDCYPKFALDVSRFTSEDARQRHVGACGGPPEVEIISTGLGTGVLAARGTVRVRASASRVFEALCDPEENKRIFDRNTASVNFRTLVEEDKVAKSRLFEVSKTGRWSLVGIPFNFESTVLALEDWKKREIRFRLKKEGAMKHMSGFWRAVPVNENEAIVMFYNEAIPSLPVPSMFRSFAGRIIEQMAASLLEDMREASIRWQSPDYPLPSASPPPDAQEPL
eukprot:CAMPEP_0115061506 /NCGR_PEP_ID=MMETSP0227-20121206/8043_1 /TAXON_ID=89957 /ORGANISM="Polarella glacialis, Strain CCMP 1383" /LENGTH=332 /DNA_ID=CAMNT_0002446811 /DNA_START=50 /DNA_END=1048 /DNA_ORIENTATION=-